MAKKKINRQDLRPEHQASNYIPIEVTGITHKIFEDLYMKNNLGETRSEFLEKLMSDSRFLKGKRFDPKVLSQDSFITLTQKRKRKINMNRRIKNVNEQLGNKKILELKTSILRFEILMAVAHMKNVSPDVKNSFKSMKKYISSEYKKKIELDDYLNMIVRKYRERFSEATRDNIKRMILSQAEDYGLTKYFNEYFFEKDDHGDVKFVQQFNSQVRRLINRDKKLKEDRGYLVPNRNYIQEINDEIFEVTIEQHYKFSFYALSKAIGIIEDSAEDEDDVVIGIRRYMGSLENDVI